MDSGDGGGGGGSSRGEPRRIVLVRRKPRTLTKLAIPSLLLALSLYNQWPGNRVYIAASPFLPFLRVPLSLSLSPFLSLHPLMHGGFAAQDITPYICICFVYP